MNSMHPTIKKVLGVLFVGGFVLAIGASASYKAPTGMWPINTLEPVDVSGAYQEKGGGLSVNTFIARGAAQLYNIARFEGSVSSENSNTINVGTSTQIQGELHATDHLNSQTLTHGESKPKEICGSSNGNIIFCDKKEGNEKKPVLREIGYGLGFMGNSLAHCSVRLDSPARVTGEYVTLQYTAMAPAFPTGAPNQIVTCKVYIAPGQTVGSVTIPPNNGIIGGGGGCALENGSETINIPDSLKCYSQNTPPPSQATPTISWSNPASIVEGTALSATQLNATASVPGTIIYSPAKGAVLSVGTHNLTASFVPTDRNKYTTASKTVSITVTAKPSTPPSGTEVRLIDLSTKWVTGNWVCGAKLSNNVTKQGGEKIVLQYEAFEGTTLVSRPTCTISLPYGSKNAEGTFTLNDVSLNSMCIKSSTIDKNDTIVEKC